MLVHDELSGRPLIIAGSLAGHRTVLDHSASATGVQLGMPLSEALARCPQAALLEPDHSLYAAHFDALLDALGHVSPLVEPDPPDAAYVGLDGLELLYQGEEGLLQALRKAIPVGLVAHIGIAAAKFPAMLAAQAAGPGQSRYAPVNLAAFLADFPLEVLPARWQTLARLHSFGLHTLGQVAALSLGTLQAQFGPEGKRLWHLSRGIDPSPLIPRQGEETVVESIAFPAPAVSFGPVLLAVEMLLGQVYAHPAMRGRCARVAILEGEIYQGTPFRRRVAFKQPQGEVAGALFALRVALQDAKLPGPLTNRA